MIIGQMVMPFPIQLPKLTYICCYTGVKEAIFLPKDLNKYIESF